MLLFSSKELFSQGLCPSLKISTRNRKQALTNPPTSVTGRASWSSPLRTQGPCPAQGKACPDPGAMSRGRRRKHHQGTILDHKQIFLVRLTMEHPAGSSNHYPSYWKPKGWGWERESPLYFFFWKTKLASGSWHLTRRSRSYIFFVTKDFE